MNVVSGLMLQKHQNLVNRKGSSVRQSSSELERQVLHCNLIPVLLFSSVIGPWASQLLYEGGTSNSIVIVYIDKFLKL